MLGYLEERNDARASREAYASGIKGWITKGYQQQEATRTAYISGIAKDPEKYRDAFKDMLGFPLNCPHCKDSKPSLSKTLLFEDDGAFAFQFDQKGNEQQQWAEHDQAYQRDRHVQRTLDMDVHQNRLQRKLCENLSLLYMNF